MNECDFSTDSPPEILNSVALSVHECRRHLLENLVYRGTSFGLETPYIVRLLTRGSKTGTGNWKYYPLQEDVLHLQMLFVVKMHTS
jgi:hypothetical protein